MNACPKCGDREGYEFSVRCLDRRVGDWGEVSECAEIEIMYWPKTVVCVACGARVPREGADTTLDEKPAPRWEDSDE